MTLLAGRQQGLRMQLVSCSERIVYLPKEKKCTTFTGGTSTTFYDWLDELNATLSHRPFTHVEKAAFIYEQLGGEARQELKYQPQAIRSDPDQVLKILKEIYGQPPSLTKLQKQFFERRQKESESVREYSQDLMAIIEEISHCKVSKAWAGEFALTNLLQMCVILVFVESLKKQLENSLLYLFLIFAKKLSSGRRKLSLGQGDRRKPWTHARPKLKQGGQVS